MAINNTPGDFGDWTGLTDDLEQLVHLIHAPFLLDDDIG